MRATVWASGITALAPAGEGDAAAVAAGVPAADVAEEATTTRLFDAFAVAVPTAAGERLTRPESDIDSDAEAVGSVSRPKAMGERTSLAIGPLPFVLLILLLNGFNSPSAIDVASPRQVGRAMRRGGAVVCCCSCEVGGVLCVLLLRAASCPLLFWGGVLVARGSAMGEGNAQHRLPDEASMCIGLRSAEEEEGTLSPLVVAPEAGGD